MNIDSQTLYESRYPLKYNVVAVIMTLFTVQNHHLVSIQAVRKCRYHASFLILSIDVVRVGVRSWHLPVRYGNIANTSTCWPIGTYRELLMYLVVVMVHSVGILVSGEYDRRHGIFIGPLRDLICIYVYVLLLCDNALSSR